MYSVGLLQKQPLVVLACLLPIAITLSSSHIFLRFNHTQKLTNLIVLRLNTCLGSSV
jgi:hypothetical protein